MEAGESTIRMGEHPTVGPVRIDLYQPLSLPITPRPPSTLDEQTNRILAELKLISNILIAIHTHLTRPPWWRRLWNRIRHVALRK